MMIDVPDLTPAEYEFLRRVKLAVCELAQEVREHGYSEAPETPIRAEKWKRTKQYLALLARQNRSNP